MIKHNEKHCLTDMTGRNCNNLTSPNFTLICRLVIQSVAYNVLMNVNKISFNIISVNSVDL